MCDLGRGDLARTTSRGGRRCTTADAWLAVCTAGPVRRNSRWAVAPPVRRPRGHSSPGRLSDRRRHRGHRGALGDGQPRRLPDGRRHGRALARRSVKTYSLPRQDWCPSTHQVGIAPTASRAGRRGRVTSSGNSKAWFQPRPRRRANSARRSVVRHQISTVNSTTTATVTPT